jgi:hypothetical protein
MLLRNLVAPGIEPGTSGLAAKKSDHQTTEAVKERPIVDVKPAWNTGFNTKPGSAKEGRSEGAKERRTF